MSRKKQGAKASETVSPKLGPADADGFQSCSFPNPDGEEVLRVSVNIDRTDKYLRKIDSQYLKGFSSRKKWRASRSRDRVGKPDDDEHDRLTRAAAILAAREGPFKGQEGKARSALLEIARGHLGKTFENCFPIVAGKALEIVSDALVKHDFNVTLQHCGPSRYPSSMKSSLMEQFSGLVALLLDIHSGPLPATRKPAPARRYSAETLRREMSLKIQELSRGGEATRKATAIRLGLSNEKALDRLRQYHSDTRRWRDVVSEALTEK